MRKRTDSPGLGSLRSGAYTAMSLLVVTVVSAVVGVVIAREFGRTQQTDGFFAAYSVFIVIVLASYAIRVAVLPDLARARAERRLAGEFAGLALTLAAIALPLVVVVEAATHSIASLLTVSGSGVSRDAAAEALRWMVPAGVAHIFAAVAASGLAALDDYATPALGYAIGSVAGLALIVARVDGSGLVAVAWGVALNASIALLVPLVVLLARAVKTQTPRGAFRPSGPPVRSRLTSFGVAVSVPLVLQLLYVVCVPFAGRDGVGAQTSLAYAYLAASALVAVTASSLGLVTSVPLTRAGLGSQDAGRHVVYASWVAYSLIGAAAGVVALAGGVVVEATLGGEYGGEVGQEIGRLIAAFSPWMAVSVAVSVTFPLAFVVGRTRRLPWIGAAALAAQIPLAWVGEAVLGLDGLAFSLALSTSVVLGALLYELGTLGSAARGLAAAALVVAGTGVVAFVPFSLLGPVPGASLGLAAYIGALALTRPRKLVLGWRYFRTLA